MADILTLQEAITSLYERAVVGGTATSTLRLRDLAAYCVQQLELRGLEGTETEVALPGGGREKQWDVAWHYQGKYRAAISLKSILKNLSGTVPNRIDDMIGEVANAQMYSPEIALGYLMVFNTANDKWSRKHGATWCELLRQRLGRLAGRKAPSWTFGTIEAFAIAEVDFSAGPELKTMETDVEAMFDRLVEQVRSRNPSLLEGDGA
ncbi:MAG: hypothetical protein ISS72_01685 [Candidatus Brocadiae bacterium]|nr:hypothetical protein [Candidatus Brocadiia bacterium]